MRVQQVQNPLITRVHSIFKELRDEASRFFNNRDQTLIRFSFGETPTFYQFKVKFTSTHKTLRFIVNKEGPQNTLEFAQLEKTRNIVLDIDEIYRVRQRDYIENPSDLKDRLQKLYLWGLRANRLRRNEIYRATAVKLPMPVNLGQMNNRSLYYDVVTGYTTGETFLDPDTGIEVKAVTFQFLSGNTHLANCTEAYLAAVRPNRIFVMNWLGRFNLLNFTSAKDHLNFSDNQFAEISGYLIQQKEAQNE